MTDDARAILSTSGAPAPSNTAPSRVLFSSAEEALDALHLSSQDAALLADEIEALGSIDSALGERVLLEWRTLSDAALHPLYNTPPLDVPAEGEYPWYLTQTCVLLSGRCVQVQRRYADLAELDAFMSGESELLPTALIVRELLLGGPLSTDRLDAIRAGTVLPAGSLLPELD